MKEWLKADSIGDVQKFYDEKYKKNGQDAFRCDNWSFFFLTVTPFFNDFRPTDSILDCGCGTGMFLQSIVRTYPKRHPFLCGIELSPTAVKLAKDNLKYRAVIAEGDYQHHISFNDSSFDIVTCWGTIEHSMDIEKAFMRLVQYAKPGGLIMITVPLDFEGCMDAIQAEENQKNNERFATEEEWLDFFSPLLNPFHYERVGDDLLLVFRKWVSA